MALSGGLCHFHGVWAISIWPGPDWMLKFVMGDLTKFGQIPEAVRQCRPNICRPGFVRCWQTSVDVRPLPAEIPLHEFRALAILTTCDLGPRGQSRPLAPLQLPGLLLCQMATRPACALQLGLRSLLHGGLLAVRLLRPMPFDAGGAGGGHGERRQGPWLRLVGDRRRAGRGASVRAPRPGRTSPAESRCRRTSVESRRATSAVQRRFETS